MTQDPVDATQDTPYRPIACATHDRLEAIAVKGREGVFIWESASGGTASAVSRIRDIKVQGGAEFLVLWDGTEIRLDRLRKVDGEEVRLESGEESGPSC